MIDITTSDGKYRYVQHADGHVVVYRHGQIWFSDGAQHNKLLRAFVQDLVDARKEIERLKGLISS